MNIPKGYTDCEWVQGNNGQHWLFVTTCNIEGKFFRKRAGCVQQGRHGWTYCPPMFTGTFSKETLSAIVKKIESLERQ